MPRTAHSELTVGVPRPCYSECMDAHTNDIPRNSPWELALASLSLRICTAYFLIVWGVSKFSTTGQSVKLYSYFYGLELSEIVPKVMGAGEILVAVLILAGLARIVSYAAGLLIHATTIVIIFPHIIDPFLVVNGYPQNRPYAAAVAAFGAFCAMFLLRRVDRWSLDEWISARRTRDVHQA